MKTIEIIWFNDTEKVHHIYFKTLYLQDKLATIHPLEIKLLKFKIKENEVPLFKKWENGNNLIWGVAREEIGGYVTPEAATKS